MTKHLVRATPQLRLAVLFSDGSASVAPEGAPFAQLEKEADAANEGERLVAREAMIARVHIEVIETFTRATTAWNGKHDRRSTDKG